MHDRMKEIVIDASVVVKWFIEETDSIRARFLRDKFIDGKIELIVPPLLILVIVCWVSNGYTVAAVTVGVANGLPGETSSGGINWTVVIVVTGLSGSAVFTRILTDFARVVSERKNKNIDTQKIELL